MFTKTSDIGYRMEKCIRHLLPEIVNKTKSCITDKVSTHSFNGFSTSIYKHMIINYLEHCHIENCYISHKKTEPPFTGCLQHHASMIGSPIHLIVRVLINWIAICMYSQVEYCVKLPLKIISNDLNERKKLLDLCHLTFTNVIIIMLKPWILWWPFGSDVHSS